MRPLLFSSGNASCGSTSTSSISGFNEAAAVQQRKSFAVMQAELPTIIASMRPLLFSSGNEEDGMKLMSFSMSFNEAAAVQQRK